MRADIKANILKQQQEAALAVSSVLSKKETDQRTVINCVHEYICHKLMLQPESSWEDHLMVLAQRSLEIALEMKLPIAKETEHAPSCGAAGTTALKIALLFRALQKDFHVSIPPLRLGLAKNTTEVGMLVYQALPEEKKGKNHDDC